MNKSQIELKEYCLDGNSNKENVAVYMIHDFWMEHNRYNQTYSESIKDLTYYLSEGHRFYFILINNKYVGYIHLGSRGALIDWLEDIYVIKEYQNQGIGSEAIRLVEQIVCDYSESLYIEAAAKNFKAIKLYAKLGYNCLNTVTLRKDFKEEDFSNIENVSIDNTILSIRKRKNS